MEKFIPYAKLSKKKQRELNAAARNVRVISPLTRKPENPKAYNRRKAQNRKNEPDPVLFVIYSASMAARSFSFSSAGSRPSGEMGVPNTTSIRSPMGGRKLLRS